MLSEWHPSVRTRTLKPLLEQRRVIVGLVKPLICRRLSALVDGPAIAV